MHVRTSRISSIATEGYFVTGIDFLTFPNQYLAIVLVVTEKIRAVFDYDIFSAIGSAAGVYLYNCTRFGGMNWRPNRSL